MSDPSERPTLPPQLSESPGPIDEQGDFDKNTPRWAVQLYARVHRLPLEFAAAVAKNTEVISAQLVSQFKDAFGIVRELEKNIASVRMQLTSLIEDLRSSRQRHDQQEEDIRVLKLLVAEIQRTSNATLAALDAVKEQHRITRGEFHALKSELQTVLFRAEKVATDAKEIAERLVTSSAAPSSS